MLTSRFPANNSGPALCKKKKVTSSNSSEMFRYRNIERKRETSAFQWKILETCNFAQHNILFGLASVLLGLDVCHLFYQIKR